MKPFRLLLPAFLVLGLLIFHKIWTAPSVNENWIRLQRTFVLAQGEPMYPARGSGPVFTAIYGPVSALVYLPALLGRSPEAAMRLASACGIAWFFVPLAAAFALGRFGAERGRPFALAAFFAAACVPFWFPSLRNAAFHVHADAPTLGLMALACVALQSGRRYFAAALFAALAAWSKQVAIPFPLILAAYVWARDGRHACVKFSGWMIACLAAVTAAVCLFFPLNEVVLNVFTIPGRHPFKGPGDSAVLASVLVRECALPLAVLAFAVLRLGVKPRSVWIWTALAMIPAAVAGHMKIGGSRNALSFTTFFALAAAFLALVEPLRRPDAFAAGTVPRAKRAIAVLAAVFFAVQAAALGVKSFVTPLPADASRTAYDFIRRHPGEGYFPRLGLIHMLAEHKIWHDSSALMDRAWAGMRISEAHFRAHVPERLRLVAFIEGTSDDRGWLELPEFGCQTTDPELPGFRVYKKEEACN